MAGLNVPANTLSDELVAIMRKVQHCPQQLVDWAVDEEMLTPGSIGAITKEEEKVPTLLTALLPDQTALKIRHKSSVVQVWWLCRTQMTREDNLSSGRVRADDDKPLDAEVMDPCHVEWVKKNGYRLLSCRLLVESTLRSLYNELGSKPRKLTVRLGENLRTQTCMHKSERSALVFRPGQTPTATVDINDEVVDKYNLWLRIRAWLYSIAFLTISEKFLSPAKADSYSELLLELMHQRFDGSPAPLSHFVTAYLQSARIWVEAVRDGKTLEAALGEEATWRHLWSTYTRPPSGHQPSSAQSPQGKSNMGADVHDNLMKEVEILRKQNKTYQSERDVALNKLKTGGSKGAEDEADTKSPKKRKRNNSVRLVAARR